MTAIYRGVVLIAAVCALGAQSVPHFAVASIRPADRKSSQPSFWRTTPAGDISVHAGPMLALIATAYGVPDFQVTGYPDWVSSEYFDVEAKVEEAAPVTAASVQARLQSLLAARCELMVERVRRPWL